jgi:hypothetical protein
LATSELNRAILPYQSSPVDRLGRGHREEGEGVEPHDREGPSRVFKARCRAGGAPSIEERGGPDPHRCHGHPLSGRCPPPGGFSFHVDSPARYEEAGHGRGRRNRISRCYPPPSFRPGPAAWLVHPPRKAGYSKATVSPAHPLATEPGTLAGSPSMLPPGGDMRTARYAQTGSAVIPPPKGVPHPRFELGTSSS